MPARKALIVANGEYDHPGLQRLHSPAADADALARVLADRSVSDFDVRVVRNETSSAIQAELEDLFAEAGPDEVLLVHFSCHGLKSETGELYFAARNTRPERLGSTAVPAGFVQRCLRISRSRSIVLLLDCCYGGAFSQGVVVRAAGEVNVLDSFAGGRGRAVITASNAMEYAFEGDRLADELAVRPSVFTGALVEGLRTGEADRDEDGLIALGELYDYVFDRVRSQNPHQTPSRDIEMQGELYVARSGRRRINPEQVPPDLAAAIADPNMFTRLGAVSELRRRLSSDRLPVAVGAYFALDHLAGTDIQHVADAARVAQEDAAIRVSASRLTFGPIAPGQRELRSVGLAGPPVARACAFTSSRPWLLVTAEDDGFCVEVVAEEPGEHEGTILVKSPVGEAVVTVELEVRGPVPELTPLPDPEPAPKPEPQPVPQVEQVPSAAPADPVAPTAGFLGVIGAVAMLLGLVTRFAGADHRLSEFFAGLTWYVGCLAAVAALGGIATLLPRTRTAFGPGLLAGGGLAGAWGMVFFLDLPPHSVSSSMRLGPGYTLQVIGHVAVLAAAAAAIWSARREGGLRLRRRPAARTAAGLVLGPAGAALFLLQYYGAAWSDSGRYAGTGAIFFGGAVIALLVPPFAAAARPWRFSVAAAVGWAVGGLALTFGVLSIHPDGTDDVPVWPITGFAVTCVLGGLLGVVPALWKRNQHIG